MNEQQEYNVKSTPVFRLKDRNNRHYQAINLKKQFGFVPEVIVVEKVAGVNNAIVVRAILTQEEIEKDKELVRKLFIP